MQYRREIDGLRALAVLPVILYHAGFGAFSGGFVGVDVFFVISGYLITTIIFNELEQGKFSVANFYERRARRILPALFLVMLVSICVAWFWLLPDDMDDFSLSLVAVSLFISNILFWHQSGYFDTAAELKPLLHTWSLAVEEQYYIIFPLVLLLLWRFGKRWIFVFLAVLAIASLLLAERFSVTRPDAAFYLLPTRGWELLMGAFTAGYLAKPGRKMSSDGMGGVGCALGLVLILYSVFTYNEETPFPGLYTLAPTVGAALIILFAAPTTLVGKLLGSRLLVGIGLISYSAYLWHQPLFAFARHISIEEPGPLAFSLLAFSSLGIAYFSWKYVETPFRSRSLFDRKQIFRLSILVAAFFVVFGLAGHFTEGFKSRFGEDVLAIAATQKTYRKTQANDNCNLREEQYDLKGCVRGNLSVQPAYALVGDSHALTLVSEMSNLFSKTGKSFVQITKNGCPLAQSLYSSLNYNCDKFLAGIFEHMDDGSIETYIILSRWSYYVIEDDFNNQEGSIKVRNNIRYSAGNVPLEASVSERKEAILQSYRDAIKVLLQSNKKVILIYPIPEQGWHIPKYASKKIQEANNKAISFGIKNSVFMERNKDVVAVFDALGNHPNLTRIFPKNVFCDSLLADRCVAYANGKPLYIDDNHLSYHGVKMLTKEIAPLLK